MVAFAVLRQATRVSPARLVARMRVSLASSSVSKVSKISTNAMNVGIRAFSGSATRFGSGTSDVTLSQKLKEELAYEKDSLTETPPDFLKSFLKDGVWTIHDKAGHDEVTLTRKFGDEDIRLMFSIADIQAEEMEELEEEDSESDVDDSPAPYPCRVSLSITKGPDAGALSVDLMVQEGQTGIERVSYYDDRKLGTDLTVEADWRRRGLYIGPQFETLDPAVQEEFEKYLQERGVDNKLAEFIPAYSAYKEQQEYVKWLAKVNNFIGL